MSVRFFDDFQVGHCEESDEIAVDPADMLAYALENDPWPIHVDEAYAASTAAGGLIASFGYVISLFFRAIHTLPMNVTREPAAFLGALEWQVRFRSGVRGTDRLRVRATVESKTLGRTGARGTVTSRCDLFNQDDELRLTVTIVSLYAARGAEDEA